MKGLCTQGSERKWIVKLSCARVERSVLTQAAFLGHHKRQAEPTD